MWIYIHGWKRNYLQTLLLRTFARREGKEKIKNNTELRKGFSIRDLYSKNEGKKVKIRNIVLSTKEAVLDSWMYTLFS